MSLTYHVVVPFDRDEEGNLVLVEPAEAPNPGAAKRRTQFVASRHVGAIAFSRIGDPDTGDFADAVILGTYGEVDRGMLVE